MSFQEKYLKYKSKYLALKNQIGGVLIKVINGQTLQEIGLFDVGSDKTVRDLAKLVEYKLNSNDVVVTFKKDGLDLDDNASVKNIGTSVLAFLKSPFLDLQQEPPKPPVLKYKTQKLEGEQRRRCIDPEPSKNKGPPINQNEIVTYSSAPRVGDRASYKNTGNELNDIRGTIISIENSSVGNMLEMQADNGTVVCGHSNKFLLLKIESEQEANIRNAYESIKFK
jgi:hypothetical protein